MYRQGDVLIIPVARGELPACAPLPRDRRGRMVLARGEATGHAHVVGGPGVQLLADLDDPELMFLAVPQHARVSHEEHGPIPLPSGDYRVVRQREYVPGSFRPVAD
ncbi:hypothetical protein [Actinoplanes sp. L3-i22]|uniref:hypothetical protein n=1 Tax=Actinoplanes sp. L3-i22 TaxID=2836373 RepID=UPI001C758C13|nr:hypothetical protein [Actinoplanes sp. L3-i22]BCY11150.1 hypothetical protein L3i22_062380 [Actinoplanes sp. L3-i22]